MNRVKLHKKKNFVRAVCFFAVVFLITYLPVPRTVKLPTAAGLVLFLGILIWLTRTLGTRILGSVRASGKLTIITFIAGGGFLIACSAHWWTASVMLVAAAPLFCWLSTAFGIAVAVRPEFRRTSGILSLLFVLTSLYFFELSLRLIPTRYLLPQVASTPLLAPPDQARIAYDASGFRGSKPCVMDCPEKLFRIVTLGGSSTYGLPLADARGTYAHHLQRLLDERRPFENFEVLNGGITGAGVMQQLDLLRERILRLKPDVITVNSWFNDNALTPGWYGVPGKSDKEAYESLLPLWLIQENAFFKKIYYTRTFGIIRHYLLKLKKLSPLRVGEKSGGRPQRMNSKEFKWALEELVSLSKTHNFLLVLMLEPLNRSLPLPAALKRNGYYRVIKEVAEKHKLPLVDLPSLMASNAGNWLFYDFIHPNPEGHRLIGESIYDAIFPDSPSEELRQFLIQRSFEAAESR